jgi:hypothetical protein
MPNKAMDDHAHHHFITLAAVFDGGDAASS